MKKGFTLLEILIVIAIIGILIAVVLSAFGGLREAGRDDRRVADLRQVQAALQLFYTKCGHYPGKYTPSTNECSDSDNPGGSWNELSLRLISAEIGFSSIPNDPVPGENYQYRVQGVAAQGARPGQCYVLRAQMETEHKSLDDKDALDKTQVGKLNPLIPAAPPLKCGKNDKGYCLTNLECKEFLK